MGFGIGVLGTMTPNSVAATQGFMRNAISAHGARSDKYKEEDERKSVGGGLMSGLGGAAAGAKIGSVIPGLNAAWGAAIGGIVGLAGYGLG
jgi:hypothetical protein